MNYFPVNLDITDRLCIVVGGGKIAERKVKGLLECNARVVVISPELTKELADLNSEKVFDWKNRGYTKGDLDGAFLAIAATDDETVQKKVFTDAEEQNLLVNVADVPERCNFILPATARKNSLTISVSTAGKSPALARLLREKLERDIAHEYGILADILGLLRPAVLKQGETHHQNKATFNRILGANLIQWIKEGDWEQIKNHLQNILGNDIDADCLNQIRNMLK